MNILEIQFHDFNKTDRAEMSIYVNELIDILPSWLHNLDIFYMGKKKGNTTADVKVEREFHRARIRIYKEFYRDTTTHYRQHILAHEFSHIVISDIVNCAGILVTDDTNNFIKNEIDMKTEAIVKEINKEN